MQVLSDNNKLWEMLYDQYGFRPRYTDKTYCWIEPPKPYKVFTLPFHCWNEQQERLVNSFFIRLDLNELFALDWEHDCFTYDPAEELPLHFEYQDEQRKCAVYFPSYYPDGDYYFFGDADWKYGLFGHPWLREIVVTGEALIQLFEDNSQALEISVK